MGKANLIISVSHAKAVERAKSIVGAILPTPPGAKPDNSAPRTLAYSMEPGHNGGTNPSAKHPGSPAFGPRCWACDCSGFVAWCIGLGRYQPDLTKAWGTEWFGSSAVTGSWKRKSGWFEVLHTMDPEIKNATGLTPAPGDIVSYAHSQYHNVGHIGLVVGPPTNSDPWSCPVIDCAASDVAVKLRPNANIWKGSAKKPTLGSISRYLKAT